MSKPTDDIAIKVQNVSKSFKLPHEQGNSIKSKLINFRKRGFEVQEALKDVSFEVKKGEFLGIVGRNGSGKSTLLKILSGIYEPTSGSVTVNGKLTPFIELGVGFNPELSGRDNVFLNGALLGFTRKQMEDMYEEIVEFAELERFMDQKLKNYSSGMQVRLAFSIAIRANTDILVLDEVLAVGDETFQRKCNEYFANVKRSRKTVVLVTHDMGSVRKFCDRAVLIRDGKVAVSGLPDVVADEYSLDNIKNSNSQSGLKASRRNSKKPFILAEVIGEPILDNTNSLNVKVTYKNIDDRRVYTKLVINFSNVPVMAVNSKILYDMVTNDAKEHVIVYKLPLTIFNKGEINVVSLLVDSDKEVNLAEFGYNNELSVIIKNPITKDKIGGIMQYQGRAELVK